MTIIRPQARPASIESTHRAQTPVAPDSAAEARERAPAPPADEFEGPPPPPPVELSGAVLNGTATTATNAEAGTASVKANGSVASATLAGTVDGAPASVTAAVGAATGEARVNVDPTRATATAQGTVSAVAVTGTATVDGATLTAEATAGTLSGAVSATIDPNSASLEANGSYTAAAAKLTVQTDPTTTYEASLQGPSIDYSLSTSAEVGLDGAKLELDLAVDATLAEANVKRSEIHDITIGGEQYQVQVDLEAMGRIGARGSIELDIAVGPNGAQITPSIDGFAGLESALTGSIRVTHEGDFLASTSLSVTQALGTPGAASLEASGSYENGVAKFEAEASTGGVNDLGIRLEGKIDGNELTEAAWETARGTVGAAFDPANNTSTPAEIQQWLDDQQFASQAFLGA